MNNIVYLQDCMDGMKKYPDKYFDLAIVDPPYGIADKRPPLDLRKYGQMKTVNYMKPNKKYFDELFRVSKNQIVWGWNHLSDMLPTTKEFIFWYKHNPLPTYSDGELAYTSFTKTAKVFDYYYAGGVNADTVRIHPTQKPVALYEWVLNNYAKEGDKILDTHVGSGSSRIAAYNLGYDFTGYEIDPIYWEAQEKRFREHTQQINLFVDEVTV